MKTQLKDDRFYTPPDVAKRMVQYFPRIGINSCLDPSCGGGNLLLAAGERWEKANLRGLDLDGWAVRKAKKRSARLDIEKGSVFPVPLIPESWSQMFSRPDLLLLNPPFSMVLCKKLDVKLEAGVVTCSVAMAHLLASISVFRPKRGVVALMPESALYSLTDEKSRQWLYERFDVEVRDEIKFETKGKKCVQTVIIVLRPKKKVSVAKQRNKHIASKKNKDDDWSGRSAIVVRGTLPVCDAKDKKDGFEFVHSTDLRLIRRKQHYVRYVQRRNSGILSGPAVLVPRVGNPNAAQIVVINIVDGAQLSDCVIGIATHSLFDARLIANAICREWSSFASLYRGTCARYVTVARLVTWLSNVGLKVTVNTQRVLSGRIAEDVALAEKKDLNRFVASMSQ